MMVAVKADAYGHGLIPISKKLIELGVDYLGVAYVEEALEIRRAGINTPILVMGAAFEHQIDLYIKNEIDICVASIEKLHQVEARAKVLGKKPRIHLKVDTGMGRIGVQWDRAEVFFEQAISCQHVELTGLFSHFADSEDNHDLTIKQINRFQQNIDWFEKHHKKPPLVHICNSGGLVHHEQAHFDMVRPGIALYGYLESARDKLRPVMKLKSKISYFKVLEAGCGVSYGHEYHAPTQTRIATLPIGYGDGYPRCLGNRGKVLIHDKAYPIAGRVCMDQLMIDLGPEGEAYVNDDVILFGSREGPTSLYALSRKANTIPYEMLCAIAPRVPRIYKA